MKKTMGIIGLSTMLLLGACSSEEQTTSTESNNKQANTVETKEEQATTNLELTQETYKTWKDSIDSVWVHYAAEFKNTGDTPIDVSNIQVNFEDAEGNIVGTAPMAMAKPDVIMPGETTYISESTILDTVTDPNVVTKAFANVDFNATDKEPHYLTTSNIKLTENTDEWDTNTPYIVTGNIVNESEEKADDIRVAAALYDEKDQLLAVLDTSLSVTLPTGGKTGFEVSYPPISPDVKGKAKTVKVIAYNWTW